MPCVLPAQSEPETATFLFADLAGYTALTEAMGDLRAADLAQEFSAEASLLLADHDAHEIKTMGDALMLHAHDPAQAISLGLRLTRHVGARHEFPAVRVGMHTGPAVERGGDWYGATVNLAARVAGVAVAGEVLLTAATVDAAGPLDDVEVVDRGLHRLRNVTEPLRVYAAVACDTCMPGSALPIDPVCRMAVDPAQRAGAIRHGDTEYSFCSSTCLAAFVSGPARYVAEAP